MTPVLIDTVVFDLSIYPRAEWSATTVDRYEEALRAGEVLPPIILEEGTNRLLDGLHRFKAHQKLGLADIDVTYETVPDGVSPKLYAASLSTRHGDRMSNNDCKVVAREELSANPDANLTTVARMLGVHPSTVGRWCSDIGEHQKEVRQVKAILLTAAGWSQRKAAELLGVTQGTVNSDLQLQIPDRVDDLIAEVLPDLPSECVNAAETVREELVFGRWSDEERNLLERHRSGQTVVVNQHIHKDFIGWAMNAGTYERIDRNSKWGNPFILKDDGDRQTVIASYANHYLPHKPSLNPSEIRGKVLGCWCHPEPCHGDVLAEKADDAG
jgi:transcriptional regulator with XRE-family HTH domain